MWPLWRGGRCGNVAIVERWPLWGCGHCGEVAVVGRWPLVGRSGRCGELAVSGGSTVFRIKDWGLVLQTLSANHCCTVFDEWLFLLFRAVHTIPDMYFSCGHKSYLACCRHCATIAFSPFLYPRSNYFSFNLSSPASVKKLAFWPFSTQMAANFGLQISGCRLRNAS